MKNHQARHENMFSCLHTKGELYLYASASGKQPSGESFLSKIDSLLWLQTCLLCSEYNCTMEHEAVHGDMFSYLLHT